MVAEGLSNQPLDSISKKIRNMGFNCVRLTWPLFLIMDDSLASVTVRTSFQRLGLVEYVSGIQANNPSLLDLPLIEVFQAVVSNLGENDVMVILDNHISKPGWCCGDSDGNGFFGDKYFDPQLWIKGLTKMASIFNGSTSVVGMSLRNELRGRKQNVKDWYKYIQSGAEAVHAANPNVLVILSGLNYDAELSFLSKKPVRLTFTGKIVYEVHWYQWYGFNGNANQVCGNIVNSFMRRAGFLLEHGVAPLFLSEFGIDQRGSNVNDNRYFNCMMGVAAELDFDWAQWTLVGSYYLRQGVRGSEEFYGMLDRNWCETRNSSFVKRLSSVQVPLQGPGISETTPYKIIYHPSTGLCVNIKKSLFEPLELGSCLSTEAWDYTPQKHITLKGADNLCLQGDGIAKPVKLGNICTDSNSKWETISESKMHLQAKLADEKNTAVCLDIDSNNNIVTNSCKCLSRDNMCDPSSQWFKIVNSTRSTSSSAVELSLPTNEQNQMIELTI
ncbi:glycosyl hydrolase 5 family protein-like isoform X2 [Papaver somniferum]|nr:glycosyl hydrolase 5 family protein-like isoform X2 [Papaver somniferum]